MSSDGLEKGAILLLSLGEDEAAEVLKQLGPREVQKLGAAMAKLKDVKRERIEEILGDFMVKAGEKSDLAIDSGAYLRSVLNKALGDDKAAGLIERILQGGDTRGIDGLKWMDSASVAELIKNEHPQIIAAILVHLDRDQACEILNCFTERLRGDVVLRIATLDGIQPTALRELNDTLTRVLTGADTLKKSVMGGIRAAAEILNFMGTTNETGVIEAVKAHDEELAQKIIDQMFVFENVNDIDDRGIQQVLREVQSEQLILALKGATPELRDKIFKNMSQRAAEMLREDLEAKGPVKLSEVEAAQKEILKTVRRMADEGTIQLGGSGGEAYV
jgi:flagellar motor switch protein FliG